MTDRFETTEELPVSDVTREMFYDLIRTIRPTTNVVDGETIKISNNQFAAELAIPRWKKFTVDYGDLSAAATSDQVVLFTLPSAGVIHGVKIKHSTAFAGGSISALTVSVGLAGDPDKHASAYDVFQAVGDEAFQLSDTMSGETHDSAGSAIVAEGVSTGDNLDQLTAGSVDIWILYSVTE